MSKALWILVALEIGVAVRSWLSLGEPTVAEQDFAVCIASQPIGEAPGRAVEHLHIESVNNMIFNVTGSGKVQFNPKENKIEVSGSDGNNYPIDGTTGWSYSTSSQERNKPTDFTLSVKSAYRKCKARLPSPKL